MPESIVSVTEGSGKKLHTWQQTIGANNVEDEFTLPGEYPLASYIVIAEGIGIATATDHTLQIMAGASLKVRIRRIRIEQNANAGAAATATFNILRLTTAGTGGAVVTAAKFDTADAASGATAMTIPTAKGTESTVLFRPTVSLRAAANTGLVEDVWEWVQHPGQKPIIIPAGAANGLALKNLVAIATASVNVVVEFVETNF